MLKSKYSQLVPELGTISELIEHRQGKVKFFNVQGHSQKLQQDSTGLKGARQELLSNSESQLLPDLKTTHTTTSDTS